MWLFTHSRAPTDKVEGATSVMDATSSFPVIHRTLDDYQAALSQLDDERSELQKREEAITTQQNILSAKLRELENDAGDGGLLLTRSSPFDLTQQDWEKLAEEGTIKVRYFCSDAEHWSPGEELRGALGLSVEDGAALAAAYAHSNERLWQVLRPPCAAVVGDRVARQLGTNICSKIVSKSTPSTQREEDQQLVANIRAGFASVPPKMDAYARLLLIETGESSEIEKELAQSLGPLTAKRVTFSPQLGMCSGTSFGPRAKAQE